MNREEKENIKEVLKQYIYYLEDRLDYLDSLLKRDLKAEYINTKK